MVTSIAKPEPIDIDFDRTAVVVVDMQNAFPSKGRLLDLAGFDISGAVNTIEVNRRLLEAGRRTGIQVIYLMMTYKPDLSDGGGPFSPNYHKELARRRRDRTNINNSYAAFNKIDTPRSGRLCRLSSEIAHRCPIELLSAIEAASGDPR